MFHPKSFGYAEMSKSNIKTIIASATGTNSNSTNASKDPPIISIDQGNLNCKAQHVDGDPKYYFEKRGTIAAIDHFCQAATDAKIKIGPGGTDLQEMALNDGHGNALDVSSTYIKAANCPKTDLAQQETNI
jgi:hypothetical protein